MQWIPGKKNLADALTERKMGKYVTLNKVISDSSLSADIFAEKIGE